MEENQERNVLISVKVSTLLIILICIIAAVVIFNVIKTKINENKNENLNIAQNQQQEEVQESTEVQTIQATSQPMEASIPAVIKSADREDINITDRSINAREVVMDPNMYAKGIEEEAVAEVAEEKIMTTTPIEEVKISKDMDLTVRTGLSREDFIKLMTDCRADTAGFFEENAGLIYDACEKYNINEIFFCGLISAESGWTIAPNHRRTFNYISLMSANGLIRFSSVEDGIDSAARILATRYLTPGGSCYHGKTLAGVKTRFCPASPTWTNLVFQRMAQIVK